MKDVKIIKSLVIGCCVHHQIIHMMVGMSISDEQLGITANRAIRDADANERWQHIVEEWLKTGTKYQMMVEQVHPSALKFRNYIIPFFIKNIG